MGGISVIIGYIIAAALMFQLLKRVNSEDELNFLFVLMWPITLVGLLYYALARPNYGQTPGASELLKKWKRSAPRGGNDEMILGQDEDQNAEDMAALIDTLSRHPDAPLPHDLTFSYKLTGISKTYPAGTMFPSTLITDWKRGYFMGQETTEAGDFPH
jgi:hypothetical protein